MERAYYSSNILDFIKDDDEYILGKIVDNNQFSTDDLQKNAWKSQIEILKRELKNFKKGHLLFEYTIPRIGKRIDNVFIYKGIIFILEFKVGEKKYPNYAVEQVVDYSPDLSNFHKESNDKLISPILICTKASNNNKDINIMKDNILETYCCNGYGVSNYIKKVCSTYNKNEFDIKKWINSLYTPTPTIVEAARALYLGHGVDDILRNDAGAKNLTGTTEELNKIIIESKKNNKKSICFVTGVPGAGKTLVGLNVAVKCKDIDKDNTAVFLSGNGPLVDVLQESLARDDVKKNKIKK